MHGKFLKFCFELLSLNNKFVDRNKRDGKF